MTWWYRWLCRLSGVLGAICEYPVRARGGPAAHCACASPREGTLGRGSTGHARGGGKGGAAGAAPVLLLWLPAGGLGSRVSRPSWLLRGHFGREPELPRGAPDWPRPGHGLSAPLRAWGSAAPTRGCATVPRGCLRSAGSARPQAASPVDVGVGGGQPPSPLAEGWLSVAWAFPEGQVVREERWFPREAGSGQREAASPPGLHLEAVRSLCCQFCLRTFHLPSRPPGHPLTSGSGRVRPI